MSLFRATAIEQYGAAALIEGPSGSGKSDLALRCISRGAKLISDDYVELVKSGKKLLASPPKNITGKIEVRGIGIRTFPFSRNVPVAVVVSLVPREVIPRLPENIETVIETIRVPKFQIHAFDASAPDKVLLLLEKS